MSATLTKFFHFSASHARDGKVFGHNYTLEIATDFLDPALESRFEDGVKKTLIQKMESRDLSLHVDFLKGTEINDLNLLQIFFKKLSDEMPAFPIHSLSLQRDSRTRVVFSP